MTPSIKANGSPVTEPREMKIYEGSNKKFRTILLKKVSELQEHIGIQLKRIRKTMREQNKKFNKGKKPSEKLNKNPRAEGCKDCIE